MLRGGDLLVLILPGADNRHLIPGGHLPQFQHWLLLQEPTRNDQEQNHTGVPQPLVLGRLDFQHALHLAARMDPRHIDYGRGARQSALGQNFISCNRRSVTAEGFEDRQANQNAEAAASDEDQADIDEIRGVHRD